MPKSNHNRNNNSQPNNSRRPCEQVLLECSPNILLYADNFIAKIIVLFLLVFFFASVIALFASLQENLMTTFDFNISNLTFILELVYLLVILLVVIRIIIDVLDCRATKYTLTDSKVIIERGFFHKENITMPYHKIGDMEVSQSILERLLGAGDIILYGGHDNSETILYDVPHPKEVEKIILDSIDNYEYSRQIGYNPNYNQQQGYNPNQQYRNPNYNQQYQNPDYGYDNNYDNNRRSQNQYGDKRYYDNYPPNNNQYQGQYQNQNNRQQRQQYNPQRSNQQRSNQGQYNQQRSNQQQYNQQRSNQQRSNQQRSNQQEYDTEYSDEEYQDNDSRYKQLKNRWDNSKSQSQKSRVDEEEIIEKHQQMFKKTRK
ncbi:MAG: PH domain-containing protein [Methanosphaera sp.]|nr:PH domain-containing protein [Methanosphaera sp.]